MPSEESAAAATPEPDTDSVSSRRSAKHLLAGLMFPGVLMPMVSTMSRVALPVIRDEFQIRADLTAWVAAAFTLPFMILMPVYGRLSDGVDKRRLILVGITIFAVGTYITVVATDLGRLMTGRAVQGIGLAGMMPLGMALISSFFLARERGRALGTWSTVGPTAGLLGPLAAGFLVAAWGWRGAFAPPLAFSAVAFLATYLWVPAERQNRPPRFLRSFDWAGVLLLASALTTFIFFLSSRPITGVAPFTDHRLIAAAVISLALFVWRERRREHPFLWLGMLANRRFVGTSFCASMRMVVMGGLTFLIPLYLVDVHALPPAQLGAMLMINAGAMALIVRLGGGMADRWHSRWLAVVGLGVQAIVMVLFYLLPGEASLAAVGAALALHGLGAGLMLAALHRAVMGSVPQAQMGAAAGLYSMFRFLGAAIGTALAGVVVQGHLDAAASTVAAYQGAFLVFAAFPTLGVLAAFGLKESAG